MEVPRKWPAIKNWSTSLLEAREAREISNGEIGNVMVIEDNDNSKEKEDEKLRQVRYH